MATHAAPMQSGDRKRLESFLRRKISLARAPLAISVALGSIGGVALIAQAWLLAQVVDAVVIGGQGLDAVGPWLWSLLGVFMLRAIVAAIGDAVAFESGARIVQAVRSQLQAHIIELGPSWTRRQRTGDLVNTAVDAAESIARYYVGYLPQRALVAFIPLAILAFVLPTDWVSAVILLVSAPLIPIFMVLIGRGAESLNQTQWRRLAHLSACLFDAIEGIATLKIFNASRAEARVITQASDAYRTSAMEVLRVAFLSSLALEFLATISIAMVAVYIGFRLYYSQLHFLPGFAVLLLAPEFFRPLRAMGAQYHARMEAIGAADSIAALLDMPIQKIPERQIKLSAAPIQEIRFEQVGFSYDGTPALEGIDFVIARGQRVALVGPSGAGKTTISQLLLGFLAPAAGRITVDGTDLSMISADSWRARIAWLPQQPTLFHGTVLDNICLGCPDADPARVRSAVAQAEASRLIDRLPNGLQTMLGDRGQGLSGGEIQRIALARVFLAEADLVVLDEPGAALDRETAALVARSINTLSQRCALLVIAHRLETVRNADEILVLQRGRIVERGRHRDLAASGATYASVMGITPGLDA